MRRLVQSSIRRIDDRPGDTAFHYDCPLERGGFEPPRPFRIRGAEFDPSLADYAARTKASVLERIRSPYIRPTQNLKPDVLMMQDVQHWQRHDAADRLLPPEVRTKGKRSDCQDLIQAFRRRR